MSRKVKEAASILLVAGIIAVLFSGAVSAADKNYKDPIGEYKSVVAYSNGPCTDKYDKVIGGADCSLSKNWNIEYAKRFYKDDMHLDTSTWSGDAQTYYEKAVSGTLNPYLTPYANGGSMPPQPDDLLSFSGGAGGRGHLAIITEVGNDYVKVIEQNWARNDAVHKIPYNKAANRIGDKNGNRGNYHIQGWLRKDSWNFNIPGNAEGWTTNPNIPTTSVAKDGKFRIDPSKSDPWIKSASISLDANNYNAIEINMASNAPDGNAEIYFITKNSPNYNKNKPIPFKVSNDGKWHTYTIYMKDHSLWKGTITGIRIDPADFGKEGKDKTDAISFDWIKIIKTEKKPNIVTSKLDNSVYQPKSKITFRYWISNPFANDIPNVKLNAAIRASGSSGAWIENDGPYQNVITLSGSNNAEAKRYERVFQLPMSANKGYYDVYLSISNQNTGYLYDYKILKSAFMVKPSRPIDDNPAYTPTNTPTPTPMPNPLIVNWHLVGNNGDAQAYYGLPDDILKGKTSITLTYNLHGLCAGEGVRGDESAIIFDQGDWRSVSLSKYGKNCKDGEQTVTIPLSDFPNLDTNANLTGPIHTRFWHEGPFTVDIYSIKFNN